MAAAYRCMAPLHCSFTSQRLSLLKPLADFLPIFASSHLTMSTPPAHQPKRVTFTVSTNQLHNVPTDVLVEHLVPLLANTAAAEPTLDQWAARVVEWNLARLGQRVTDLPEYHPLSEMSANWRIEGSDLTPFANFGPCVIPFSVYRELWDDESKPIAWSNWAGMLRVRLQGRRNQMVSRTIIAPCCSG